MLGICRRLEFACNDCRRIAQGDGEGHAINGDIAGGSCRTKCGCALCSQPPQVDGQRRTTGINCEFLRIAAGKIEIVLVTELAVENIGHFLGNCNAVH